MKESRLSRLEGVDGHAELGGGGIKDELSSHGAGRSAMVNPLEEA